MCSGNLYVRTFSLYSNSDGISLLVTEKVKQTVKVPDVTMETTTQDDDLNENTELAILVSV